MREGVALTSGQAGELTAVRFDEFVFDLSDLLREEGERVPRPSEYPVRRLLSPTPEMLARGSHTLGDFVSEGHYKLTMPLLALVYPMIALVTLLAGGYRRSGFGRRVVVAVCGRGAAAGACMFAVRGPRAGAARALAADVPAGPARRRLCRSAAAPAQPRAGGAGMTLVRYLLRGFLRTAHRGLRGDRAGHPALHLGREPAPLRRVGRERRRHRPHHPAAGARRCSTRCSRWC